MNSNTGARAMTMKRLGRQCILPIAALFLGACGGSGNSNDSTANDLDLPQTSGETIVLTPGNHDGTSNNALDRVGRPAIIPLLIVNAADRDDYNAAGDPTQWRAQFGSLIASQVQVLDTFDGQSGNALLMDAQALADLLVDDRLQIDTSVPECNQYLALERQLGGCGGRTLDRDVIDDTLQTLVSAGVVVSDFVDSDNVILSQWPFIGVANP